MRKKTERKETGTKIKQDTFLQEQSDSIRGTGAHRHTAWRILQLLPPGEIVLHQNPQKISEMILIIHI